MSAAEVKMALTKCQNRAWRPEESVHTPTSHIRTPPHTPAAPPPLTAAFQPGGHKRLPCHICSPRRPLMPSHVVRGNTRPMLLMSRGAFVVNALKRAQP
uniref:Uncharacterized protein n=1 Tax=Knipowitschia caucasica TaxID=637954 RepID=A0AAV2MKP8_KNICA